MSKEEISTVEQKRPMKRKKCKGYKDTYTCENYVKGAGVLCDFCKGRKFELEVVELLHQLGAIEVTHNIDISGNQCDIRAKFKESLGTVSYYIECKAHQQDVGIAIINQFHYTVEAVKDTDRIDKGIIVSASGFTNPARHAAEKLGIQLLTIKDIQRGIADFTAYIQNWIKVYQEDKFFKSKHYIELTGTTENEIDVGTIDHYLEDWVENTHPENFILLLGDYGTGKTTTVKRLMWRLGKRYLRSQKTEQRIPLFINLREYNKATDLKKLITGLLIDDYGVQIKNFTTFKRLNDTGKFVVILDGFDEMAARTGPQEILYNFNQFEQLISSESKVILTCRTHFFKSTEHLREIEEKTKLYRLVEKKGYNILNINPLSIKDIEIYVTKVASSQGWERIRENARLMELAERPILLDMIITSLRHIDVSKDIKITDLYEIYTKKWLDRDDWRCKLPREKREFFSIELALHFWKNNLTDIHYSKLPDRILKEFPDVDRYRDLEHFDIDIRTSTFLTRDSLGNYSFAHKSFYEYMVALAFSRDIEEGITKNFGEKMITHEIALFLRDILKSRTRLYEWIKETSSKSFDIEKTPYLGGNAITVLSYCNEDLRGKDFSNTILIGANLERANLAGCNFENANLKNANLDNSVLRDANFKKANLENISFKELNEIRYITLSPNSTVIAGMSEETAYLWDIEACKEILSCPVEGYRYIEEMRNRYGIPIDHIRFSPDSKYVAIVIYPEKLSIFDIKTGKEVHTIRGEFHPRYPLFSFSPDSKYAAILRDSKKLSIFDIKTGKEVHTITGVFDFSGDSLPPIFSPDGKYAVTMKDSETLSLWSVETGKEVHTITGVFNYRAVGLFPTFSPDSKYVVTVRNPETLSLWSVETGKEVHTIRGEFHSNHRLFSFSPDSKYVATVRNPETLSLWSVETGKEVHTITGAFNYRAVGLFPTFSPDSKYVATVKSSKSLSLWSVETGKGVHTIRGEFHPRYPLFSFSPDSKYVATVKSSKSLSLWSVETGKEVHKFRGKHSEHYYTLIFSSNNSYIVASGRNPPIVIWDLETIRTHGIIEQKIDCEGMKINNAKGLTEEQIKFLEERGASRSEFV